MSAGRQVTGIIHHVLDRGPAAVTSSATARPPVLACGSSQSNTATPAPRMPLQLTHGQALRTPQPTDKARNRMQESQPRPIWIGQPNYKFGPGGGTMAAAKAYSGTLIVVDLCKVVGILALVA